VDLDPHVQQLSTRLAAAAPDEASAATVSRLLTSLEPAVHLLVIDVLGLAALELSDRLPSGHVELRLAGRDVELLYVDDAPADDAPSRTGDDDGAAARITLRLPESLKTEVENAAAVVGQSTNTWLVQAVRLALEGRSPRRRANTGRHFSGYATS
jgi:hypothetical protein